jgi:hypothetical protein
MKRLTKLVSQGPLPATHSPALVIHNPSVVILSEAKNLCNVVRTKPAKEDREWPRGDRLEFLGPSEKRA